MISAQLGVVLGHGQVRPLVDQALGRAEEAFFRALVGLPTLSHSSV